MVEWPGSNCRQNNNVMQNTNNIEYWLVKQDSKTMSGNVDPQCLWSIANHYVRSDQMFDTHLCVYRFGITKRTQIDICKLT